MSMGSVHSIAAERRAEREREKREHEAKLQRQILDWISVVKPQRGHILVLRVPDDKFIHPGTAPEDMTDEQKATMQACHDVMTTLVQNLQVIGTHIGGACILAESMRLEDLPLPNQSPIVTPTPGIILPPGTKI
jgi:hypothetical protein